MSLFETIILVAVVFVVNGNGLASGLGVECIKGEGLMALLWISNVLMLICSIAWLTMWFKQTYVRRAKVGVLVKKERGRRVVRTAESNFREREIVHGSAESVTPMTRGVI